MYNHCIQKTIKVKSCQMGLFDYKWAC